MIQDSPLAAVVIPCYNYGKYVRETVRSALNSTYPNLEVVVVNDGSTDEMTLKVLLELEKVPQVKVINRPNGGLAAARNTGFNSTNADFIIPLDADDLIEPTFIEKGIWLLQQYKEYSFTYPLVQLFQNEDRIWETLPYNFHYLKFRNYIPATIIIRKSAWEEVKGYDESFRSGYEDWEFLLRLGKNRFIGLHMHEVLFFYRKHHGSMLQGSKKKHKNLVQQIRATHSDLYRFVFLQFFLFCLMEFSRRSKKKFGKIKSKIFQMVPNSLKETLKKIYYSYKREPFAPIVIPVDKSLYPLDGNKKERIVLVLPWLHVGGVEKVFLQIVKHLNPCFSFTLVTTEGNTDHPFENEFKPFVESIFHLGDFGNNEYDRASFFLYLIKSKGIKVVHVSNSKFGYRIIPTISELFPELGIVDTLHMEEPWAPWDYFRVSKSYSSFIDVRVTLTESQKRVLQRDGNSRNIVVIPNGVSPPAQERETLNRPFTIGFIARLVKQKQPQLFIRMADECRKRELPFQFLMVGEGELKADCEKLIRRSTLDDFIDLERFNPDVYSILEKIDVLCIPSLREGLPMTGLEAMLARVPIVATDVPGWSDIIQHGETGLLCELDPFKLADGCQLLFEDKNLYDSIWENALDQVISKYSVESMVGKYQYIYQSLLSKGF